MTQSNLNQKETLVTAPPPAISVVIPAYNAGRFICAAIDSVLAQTLPPLEIIVIDDGSTDDTRERLRAYVGKIRYFHQTNQGVSKARNTGIKASKGEWIAFLDSDDIWHSQKIERQHAALQLCPQVRALGTDHTTFKESIPDSTLNLVYSAAPCVKAISVKDLMWGHGFCNASNVIIHRECFHKVGLFDESLQGAEDFEMWIRLAAEYNIGRLQEDLVFVRVHHSSMSFHAEKMRENQLNAIRKIFSLKLPIKHRWFWNHVVIARMHRGVAWMYYEHGNRCAALAELWESFLACPITSGKSTPLIRLRMAINFFLS